MPGRGTPDYNEKYDRLTFWEQLDGGTQYTLNKKFLTIIPIVLCARPFPPPQAPALPRQQTWALTARGGGCRLGGPDSRSVSDVSAAG